MKETLNAIIINTKWFIVFVVLFLLGVIAGVFSERQQKKVATTAQPVFDSAERIDSLRNRVRRGDTEAYAELSGRHSDYPPQDILFYAIYMANKYGYRQACCDVYVSLTNSYPESSLCKMDRSTRNFALKYLYMAVQKNDPRAISELAELKSNECFKRLDDSMFRQAFHLDSTSTAH